MTTKFTGKNNRNEIPTVHSNYSTSLCSNDKRSYLQLLSSLQPFLPSKGMFVLQFYLSSLRQVVYVVVATKICVVYIIRIAK